MELETAGISLGQQRPSLLSYVNLQRSLYQVSDHVLRRHDHVYGPQAPLDRHVEKQPCQPAGGTPHWRSRIESSRDISDETAGRTNDIGASVPGESLKGPVGGRR